MPALRLSNSFPARDGFVVGGALTCGYRVDEHIWTFSRAAWVVMAGHSAVLSSGDATPVRADGLGGDNKSEAEGVFRFLPFMVI